MAAFAEFFAGIGLVREAIEPLGWECAFANDISPGKAEMYEARFGAQHLVVDDINRLAPDDLPGDVDLVTASFPCIDLSLAGNRAGLAGEHSGTVWAFLKLLAARCRRGAMPTAVLLENVTGFLSSRGGDDLAEVCAFLAQLGYAIDLAVVDARWFTPQSRPRLFVMGCRQDATGWPPATQATSRTRPASVRRFQQARPWLPFLELPLPEAPRQTSLALADVLEAVRADDERWWPEEQTARMLRNMAPPHRQRVDALATGHAHGVATLYRRCRRRRTVGEIRRDAIAGCLRTPQGGSSVQFLVDCRSGKPRIRPLTGREYARLQGADGFPIHVGDRQARMGFGDAVCVPAVRWLVRHAFAHVPAEVPMRSPQRSLFDDASTACTAPANGSTIPAQALHSRRATRVSPPWSYPPSRPAGGFCRGRGPSAALSRPNLDAGAESSRSGGRRPRL